MGYQRTCGLKMMAVQISRVQWTLTAVRGLSRYRASVTLYTFQLTTRQVNVLAHSYSDTAGTIDLVVSSVQKKRIHHPDDHLVCTKHRVAKVLGLLFMNNWFGIYWC